MAKSGISAAKLLKKLGGLVTLQDSKNEEALGDICSDLRNEGIELYLGANPDDIVTDFDFIVMSPGVPADLPFVLKAREAGIEVIGETELAFRLCKAPAIGITGTNGKTTTTTLVGDILKEYNKNTFVVGNIGNAFCDEVLDIPSDGAVAAELSSFQLETSFEMHLKVSAVLNITPDHLNRHHTLENYIEAKEKVYINQTKEDYCVLNANDEATKAMAGKTNATVVFFSLGKKVDGLWSDKDSIYVNAFGFDEKLIDIDELNILGDHNVENAMAAAACTLAFGVPIDTVRKVLREFKAVEHRIEYVAEVNGVKYYNDSKGTNPDASIKAVLAMRSPICIIAGGYDKGSEFDEFISYFKGRVKFTAVIGAVKDKIVASLEKADIHEYKVCDTFEQAIDACKEHAESGDCVLLSPACASWDMFKSYEQRGEIFKDYVRKALN